MHRTLALLLLALIVGACAPATSARPSASRSAAALPPTAVRHVVVFKYKAGATPEQIRQVTQAFAALKDKIPGILAFEHGVNDSPEGLDQGFTHVHLLTFSSAAARDAYLPHPEHQEFGRLLGRLGVVEGVFVVDYSPRE
jgi:hypothetical protein